MEKFRNLYWWWRIWVEEIKRTKKRHILLRMVSLMPRAAICLQLPHRNAPSAVCFSCWHSAHQAHLSKENMFCPRRFTLPTTRPRGGSEAFRLGSSRMAPCGAFRLRKIRRNMTIRLIGVWHACTDARFPHFKLFDSLTQSV